jgi:hypothetical protein
MTTSANGTYKISQESTEDIPEDQMNVTKGLSEAPNQSLEDNNTNILDFSPTSKGKPQTYPTTLFTLQSMSICLYLCIKSRNCNETLDAWILGIQCIVPESLSDRCSANRTGSVTVRVLVMLDLYFVSVKYVFVRIKLMCVFVKFLKV